MPRPMKGRCGLGWSCLSQDKGSDVWVRGGLGASGCPVNLTSTKPSWDRLLQPAVDRSQGCVCLCVHVRACGCAGILVYMPVFDKGFLDTCVYKSQFSKRECKARVRRQCGCKGLVFLTMMGGECHCLPRRKQPSRSQHPQTHELTQNNASHKCEPQMRATSVI